MAEPIQATYDELDNVASAFDALAEQAEQVEKSLNNARSALDGEWEGFGGERFFGEMDEDILPSLTRLAEALRLASTTTSLIKDEFLETEKDDALNIKALNAIPKIDKPSNMVPLGMTPQNTDTSQPIDTDEIFTEDYYDELFDGPDSDIEGAGEGPLEDAMTTLSGNPTPEEINTALDQIAKARDIPRDQIQRDYEQFLQLKADAEQFANLNGRHHSPALDQVQHPNFMGSEEQLQTGKIIGDALGIDPVFGSLLSPTGGIVGKDNHQVSTAGNDTGVGRHGIVHDAAGYLLKYHDSGPGYDYLNQEPGRPGDHPMTGQESGIKYWQDRMGESGYTATKNEVGGRIMGKIVDYQEYLENEHDYETIYGTGHDKDESSYDKYSNN